MNKVLRTIFGVGIGVLLFWFAISSVDLTTARSILSRARLDLMVFAVAVYWIGIAMRVSRWRILLSTTRVLSFAQVANCLVVGYAVNNILPARLGEVFRADYVRRRYGVARTAALGSIIIERVLDALTVLTFLLFGLLTANLNPDQTVLAAATWLASGIIAAAIAFVVIAVFWHDWLLLAPWPWLRDRVALLVRAMSIVRQPIFLIAIAASFGIWILEAGALKLILSGFGVDVGISGVCLIIGAAAFSTLLPSAPGYIGSLQIAYILTFSALNIPSIFAVLVSTATQILMLGSVTLGGVAIYLGEQLYKTVISVVRRPFDPSI